MLSGKTVLITGSKGFIGSRLTALLKAAGSHIIEADLKCGVDVTNFENLSSLGRFDVAVHLAGLSYVPDSYERPLNFFRTNVDSTFNVLELCRKYRASMVLSSSYIYGHPNFLPINEDHPRSGFNPYAQTKIMCEDACEAYHKHFKVPVVVARPFNIYGPGQPDQFLIPTIINQYKTGKVVLKDSRPKRDFIHVDDVASAFARMAEFVLNSEARYNVFNLGSGISYSIAEIIGMITAGSGRKIEVNYTNEERPAEVADVVADISKARELLSWTPEISMKKGLEEMLT